MIQNIVEDQIQYNSEITAQPIIWREIDQAEGIGALQVI